jgi:GT2 family glycosyltransferase
LQAVSIVVVSFNSYVCTRLCIESILDNTGHSNYELIVVDNASTDMTPAYLEALARENRHVTVIQNGTNMGFPHAVNQGVTAAQGGFLVILNNDVVVPPRWLSGLLTHLADGSVGAVGPVTNRAPNEACVDVAYNTYGEFIDVAQKRSEAEAGDAFEIDVLTLFCTAIRRSTWELVGPLDESFAIGMFEDDDLAERLRASGLRLLCAEDVFVHHFGEGALGALVANGEHGRLFERNRALFEQKWGHEWQPHRRRETVIDEDLRKSFRALIEEQIPEYASVVVVSRGDDALLRLGARRAVHFTQDALGEYAGHHPANGDEAVARLERLKARGAQYVAVPASGFWWLDHYRELREYLSSGPGHLVAESPAARIFALDVADQKEQSRGR